MSRFIQITDFHIGNETDFPLGVNLRQNFLNILEEARSFHPDYYLFSGDFCLKSPEKEIYTWLKPKLDDLKTPYFVIRGNHDDTTHFFNTFHVQHLLNKDRLYYEKIIEDVQFLFLDSAIATIDDEQLSWMQNKLLSYNGKSIIIVHHPPCLAGLPHMDEQHCLKNWKDVQEIIRKNDQLVNIFCGHYHSERTVSIPNANIFITPSLYVQISDQTDSFSVEHYRPGFRIIDLENQSLMTRVHYIEPHRF